MIGLNFGNALRVQVFRSWVEEGHEPLSDHLEKSSFIRRQRPGLLAGRNYGKVVCPLGGVENPLVRRYTAIIKDSLGVTLDGRAVAGQHLHRLNCQWNIIVGQDSSVRTGIRQNLVGFVELDRK